MSTDTQNKDAHAKNANATVEGIKTTLNEITDPTDRAKAASALLDAIPTLQSALREIRQTAVLELRAQGLSHNEVGIAIGTSRSRAQQIAEGRTSGSHAKQSAS